MIKDIAISQTHINFAPSSEAEEVIQNVITICTTMKASVPLDRAFGVEGSIDLPVNLARAKLSAEFINAIHEFEPRAKVSGVYFREGDNHEVLPVVSVVMA